MALSYHLRMRLLLFVLSLVVLPLQGWAADVMALKMAYGSVNAIHTVADYAYSARAGGQFTTTNLELPRPCTEHAGAAPQGTAVKTPSTMHLSVSHDPCNTGSSCQMCHTVAVLPDTPTMVPPPASHPTQAAGPSLFASAPAALRLKPPIG